MDLEGIVRVQPDFNEITLQENIKNMDMFADCEIIIDGEKILSDIISINQYYNIIRIDQYNILCYINGWDFGWKSRYTIIG